MSQKLDSFMNGQEADLSIVQNIFCSTTCYDLMQGSSKGTVFETSIPYQLAFYALVEHDTDVAPLWDPERRSFVGLMTVGDYIQALRKWRNEKLPMAELANRSISELLSTLPSLFQHNSFQSIDAEDSVNQMCKLLLRSGNDYTPVIDPDNGNLVSILGYLDIVHLFNQTAKQYPQVFNIPIRNAGVGTFKNIATASKHSKLAELLDIMDQRRISAIPIVDDNARVIGIYHRSDVSFIIKAADQEAVLSNLSNYRADETLQLRDQLLTTGDIMSAFQSLAMVKINDSLVGVFQLMMNARATRVVVVDDTQKCVGVISIRDLVTHFLNLR